MFVCRKQAGRVIIVSAALVAAEEAARISPKSTPPKDGGDVKEPRNVVQILTAFLSFCLPRMYGERENDTGVPGTRGAARSARVLAKDWHVQRKR